MEPIGALELGGTWLRIAVGTSHGRVHARERVPLPEPSVLVDVVAETLQGMGGIRALGVAAFGPLVLDPASPSWGTVLGTPKPGWSGVPLGPRLRQRLGVPVALETDVAAAALGEHGLGAGRGAETLAYLTVGTGVGAGLRLGDIRLGGEAHPEFGHIRVARDPRDRFPGVCPFHGDCLEGLASGPALAARTGRPAHQLSPDHPAWGTTARLVARGVHALRCGFGLERVVLGGGVGTAPGMLGRVREALGALDSGYTPGLRPERDLVAPGLGADAALVGALLLAGAA